MERNPWTDPDGHWSGRAPPGSPGFMLPPLNLRQFGDEQVVKVAEEVCRDATGNTLRCMMNLCCTVSAVPLNTTVLALYRHRGCTCISRANRGLANPQGCRVPAKSGCTGYGGGWLAASPPLYHPLPVFGHLNRQPLPKLHAYRIETVCVFQQSRAEFPQRLVVSRDLIQNCKSFTSTSGTAVQVRSHLYAKQFSHQQGSLMIQISRVSSRQ